VAIGRRRVWPVVLATACLLTAAASGDAGGGSLQGPLPPQAAVSALQRQMRADVEMAIRLALQSGDAKSALDSYDRYFASVRAHDPVLLASVARVVLTAIAPDRASPAHVLALERLAGAGDARARSSLGEMAGGSNTLMLQGVEADSALARLGDLPAVDRLIRRLADDTIRDKGGIVDVLIAAQARRAAFAIVALLGDENPFNRMAAARGLASLGSPEHVPQLRDALERETEGPVKPMLAVALKSLGSAVADARIAQFGASPVSDVRLLVVEAYYNARLPQWPGLARQLLRTGSEGTRLRAAELLGDSDEGARREIGKAATSANLPTREIGAKLLESTGSRDLAVLATLLRDTSPVARTYAAGALLAAARPATPRPRL